MVHGDASLSRRMAKWWVWLCRTAMTIAWVRVLVRLLRQAYGYVIGEALEDEEVAFSARKLMVNDTYRDRLLAPEIEELVELCEALHLTIPQRKAYFRCFLHLDSMRRAGVSRAELLRYCGLRDTPLARHILPSEGPFSVLASTHRSTEFRTQRWDVVQLFALMFSVCTMDVATLVEHCTAEVISQPDGIEGSESSQSRIVTDIRAWLTFAFGVPSPVERTLGEFLCRLCTERCGSGERSLTQLLHVDTMRDVAGLFPVLVFPVVWNQRVIMRRILGEATWSKLSLRRAELRLAGLENQFVGSTEIVHASKVLVSTKPSARRFWSFRSTHDPADDAALLKSSSTPRKVLPVDEPSQQIQASGSSSGVVRATVTSMHTENDAWRATADSVIASTYLLQLEPLPEDVLPLFHKALDEITTAQFASAPHVQRFLIQQYGYQFTTFVFGKSSLGDRQTSDLVATPSVRKEQSRATARYQKADKGLHVVKDKATYWKEYTDLLLKRVFYHNVRTGESRWEVPSTVLESKRRKRRRRSPARSKTLQQ